MEKVKVKPITLSAVVVDLKKIGEILQKADEEWQNSTSDEARHGHTKRVLDVDGSFYQSNQPLPDSFKQIVLNQIIQESYVHEGNYCLPPDHFKDKMEKIYLNIYKEFFDDEGNDKKIW